MNDEFAFHSTFVIPCSLFDILQAGFQVKHKCPDLLEGLNDLKFFPCFFILFEEILCTTNCVLTMAKKVVDKLEVFDVFRAEKAVALPVFPWL